ncbi:hypothetical protein FQN53_005474 [Emmonsiellopsis sp. PD_33]|nr:hypothetical protein FQN53_005474 [Emmonsiellopsis sp. PD_33]
MHLTHPLTTLLIGLAAATPIAGAPMSPQPATVDVAKRLPGMLGENLASAPAEALVNKRLANNMLNHAQKDRNTDSDENDKSSNRGTVGSMSGGPPIKQRNQIVSADVGVDGNSLGVDLRRSLGATADFNDGISGEIGTGIERRALLGGLLGPGNKDKGKDGKTSAGLLGDILGRRGGADAMWASKDEADTDAAPVPKVEKRIDGQVIGSLVGTVTKTAGGVLNGRGVADAQWAAKDEADAAPAPLPKAEKRLVGELVNGVLGAVTGQGGTVGGRSIGNGQLAGDVENVVFANGAKKRFVPELLGSALGGDGRKGQEKGEKGGEGEKGEGEEKKERLGLNEKLDKYIAKQVEKELNGGSK